MSATTTQTTTTSTIPLTSTPSSSEVHAPLNFFDVPKDGQAPYNYVHDPPEGVPRSNLETAVHTVSINNMRGSESSFNIDKNAFLPLPSTIASRASTADFSSDESVKETYYPEVEKLLLEHLPGSPRRVLIFDHTIRRSIPGATREPVLRVHIDQTPASAKARVLHHLPDEAEELLKGRYRLVNVWRPLNGTVESSPLAVADSQTVQEKDLVGVRHIYPDREGETAGVYYNEGMKWWYWGGMGNEERLLLQCFDSETRTRVPHTAFKLPEQEGKKQRESIEVRALIFG